MHKIKYIILLFIPVLALAGYIEHTVTFSQADLNHYSSQGYDIVRLKGCAPSSDISHPELAVYHCMVLIPPDAEIKKVKIISANQMLIPGHYNILPVQYPEPFSLHEPVPFIEPNKEIYAQSTEYPGVIAKHTHTGTKGGFRIATIKLYPLQYIPRSGELSLYTNIAFRIEYEIGKVEASIVWDSEYKTQKQAVKGLVINPGDVDQWAPSIKTSTRCRVFGERGPTFVDPEYAIMVANGLESYLEPLREWKNRKGIPTEIFLRDWILSNYSGSTNEAKVRNFIIDYHQNHGTVFFLCVGDWGDFPMRLENTGVDNTPSDFYYQDYDDDWYSEVYVGRASVDNATEAQTFVDKVFKYERESPGTGFHEKIFMPGYELWSGYGSPVCDTIAKYDPVSWLDAKRYDWVSSLSTQEVSDSLNVGFGYTQISAHGLEYGWGSSSTIMHDNDDADALTNAPPYTGIMTAICCQIGALDYSSDDCYVEHMQNNASGGTAAFWGNTRNGYGRIDNPGRSEWQCIWFYEELNDNNLYQIGKTCAASKDRCVPYVSDEYVRHCLDELTLYGDPEMCLWQYFPENLVVTHNSSMPVGSATYDVTVDDGRAPVADAQVCLMCQTDTMYRVGYTNASGVASFTTDPEIEGDTCWVTVTKLNYQPYEGFAITTLVGMDETRSTNLNRFVVEPPYPNPAQNYVVINYTLPHNSDVSLKIYNAAGRFVKSLLAEKQKAGKHTITWRRNDGSNRQPAGIYFCELTVNDQIARQKIIIIGQ